MHSANTQHVTYIASADPIDLYKLTILIENGRTSIPQLLSYFHSCINFRNTQWLCFFSHKMWTHCVWKEWWYSVMVLVCWRMFFCTWRGWPITHYLRLLGKKGYLPIPNALWKQSGWLHGSAKVFRFATKHQSAY